LGSLIVTACADVATHHDAIAEPIAATVGAIAQEPASAGATSPSPERPLGDTNATDSDTQIDAAIEAPSEIANAGVPFVGRDVEPGTNRSDRIEGFCAGQALRGLDDYREQWAFEEGDIERRGSTIRDQST
jgi:hypothetical protein